ncbi:MAG: cytidylate kinase, partial [Candidatus Diapherotrites archaeon]|nr:cytidylate kinase [Candidatus Diapherotrites archaeon]
WYGINIEDVSVYDLIINTEKWDIDGVLFIITKALQRMKKKDFK